MKLSKEQRIVFNDSYCNYYCKYRYFISQILFFLFNKQKLVYNQHFYDIIVKYYLLKKEKESLIEKNFTYLTYNIRQTKFQEIFFQKI